MKLILLLLLCVTVNAFGFKFKSAPTHHHYAKGFRVTRTFRGERHLMGLEAAAKIPDSLDLRGKISPILDQGQCGSCYSFGTQSSLTDALMLQKNSKGVLSPQYYMDYSGNGCNGGWFDVMGLSTSPNGSPLLSAYPYVGADQSKKPYVKSGSSLSYAMLGSESGVTPRDIESYMVTYNAPVPVDMAAGAGSFEDYQSGVYDNCVANAQLDHIVAIVGWSNEGATFQANGFLPAGKGYWIGRNSWGLGFGEAGFFRIAMTDAQGNRCNAFASDAGVFFFHKR